MELKICPCGKIPDKLCLMDTGQGGKWAIAGCNCCGEWNIEFRTKYHALNSNECMELAVADWNRAPRPSSQWISVKDRLPVDPVKIKHRFSSTSVIVLTRHGNVFSEEYNCGKLPEPWWKFGDFKEGHIIKWQPLPLKED